MGEIMTPDEKGPRPAEELVRGDVVMTPSEPLPYKVVFRRGEVTISEHPVSSVQEGEDLIKEELPNLRVSARDKNRNA